jgi:hypothetical protein
MSNTVVHSNEKGQVVSCLYRNLTYHFDLSYLSLTNPLPVYILLTYILGDLSPKAGNLPIAEYYS